MGAGAGDVGGAAVSLAEHIDVGKQLMVGRWVVLLVHHDCEDCAAEVNAECRVQNAESRTKTGQRVAVVEMPPYSSAGDRALWGTLPVGVLGGRLDERRDWFASTPYWIVLQDDRVVPDSVGGSTERGEASPSNRAGTGMPANTATSRPSDAGGSSDAGAADKSSRRLIRPTSPDSI